MNDAHDSIETSVFIKIFRSREDAVAAHMAHSQITQIPMSQFTDVANFNPNRLQKTAAAAYPLNNRPRGIKDLQSVEYHQSQKFIKPIWMICENGKYTLLDGAHRIVASYINNLEFVSAHIIAVIKF
jgi:hypothetical protein